MRPADASLICNTGMARSGTQPQNEGDCPAEINPSQATLPRSALLRPDSDLRASSETPISFTLMVHHVVLYKLKPEVTPARVEAMMMNTRMQLLKIPEVLNIKCGKRIDPELPWPFFIAIDFESMDKYAIFREDPIFVKFMEEVIKPNTEDSLDLDFEMDPGKDVRFS
jgi:Stress responsive A/B Barrel Domain